MNGQSNTNTAEESFSLVKHAKSFVHAGRGVKVVLKTTHNAWVQICIFIAAVALGIYVQLAYLEWIMIIFASGLVFTAEAFNTAIEIDIDLTSPEYHPFARDTKDVAAGAVLIASVSAAIIGIMIFAHHLA